MTGNNKHWDNWPAPCDNSCYANWSVVAQDQLSHPHSLIRGYPFRTWEHETLLDFISNSVAPDYTAQFHRLVWSNSSLVKHKHYFFMTRLDYKLVDIPTNLNKIWARKLQYVFKILMRGYAFCFNTYGLLQRFVTWLIQRTCKSKWFNKLRRGYTTGRASSKHYPYTDSTNIITSFIVFVI